jgi:hypothetical protein
MGYLDEKVMGFYYKQYLNGRTLSVENKSHNP